MTKPKWALPIVLALMALGIFCQFWQFAHRQSFWKDETGLARNFLVRDITNIHVPFGQSQAAPIGFVQLSKLSEMWLGHSEHAFWLLPLLMGALGILLAAKVWKGLLPVGAWVVGVGLWALNPTLISHITQFKPYLTDAVVALALTGAFFYYRQGRKGGAWLYLLTGLWALWMSYASVFVLAGFGLWMLVESARVSPPGKVLRVVAVNAVLAAVFVALWWTNYRFIDADGGFHAFWTPNFAPWPWEAGALEWWSSQPLSTLGYIFGQEQGLMWALLTGVGIAVAARKHRPLLALLLPVGLTVVASLLRLYPLYDRLEIFWAALLTPFVALAVAELWQMCRSRVLAVVLVLCVALPYLWPLRVLTHVKDPQELKQTSVLVSHRAAPGDVVYIHGRAAELYKYYFKRYPVAAGVEVILGQKDEAQDLYAMLYSHFAGRHVWVMFTEPYFADDEIARLVMQADAARVLHGMADFSVAGALELQL